MVLMKKGNIPEFVPDCFVANYRKNGYIVVGEEVTPDTDDEPVNDENPADEDTDKFICPHCGREYKSEANLEKHIAEKHAE